MNPREYDNYLADSMDNSDDMTDEEFEELLSECDDSCDGWDQER